MWMRQPQNLTRFCLPCKKVLSASPRSSSLSRSHSPPNTPSPSLAHSLCRALSIDFIQPVARCIISFINCSSGLKRLNTDKGI